MFLPNRPAGPWFPRLLLVTVINLSGVLPGCQPLFHRHVSGMVLEIEGDADVTHASRKSCLTNEGWISAEDRFATEPSSRLKLLLLPGILVQLEPRTTIEIVALRLQRNGNDFIRPMTRREASIRLLGGTLFVSVARPQTHSRLSILTSLGKITAGSGRTFKVSLDEKQVHIMSVRGKVHFEPSIDERGAAVGAGSMVDLPGANGSIRVADAGPRRQNELMQILTVEKKMLSLEEEKHAHLMFPPSSR